MKTDISLAEDANRGCSQSRGSIPISELPDFFGIRCNDQDPDLGFEARCINSDGWRALRRRLVAGGFRVREYMEGWQTVAWCSRESNTKAEPQAQQNT